MFPRNSTISNLHVVRTQLARACYKGKSNPHAFLMRQYVVKITWSDEAVETNLYKGSDRSVIQTTYMGKTNLQPFGMRGQISSDEWGEHKLMQFLVVVAWMAIARVWVWIHLLSTCKFSSGPNLGLFMYTSPAVETAFLTSQFFKKSPWINWMGECLKPRSWQRFSKLKDDTWGQVRRNVQLLHRKLEGWPR